MDYASGNYYGKYLIRAYYFNKMSEDLREEFSKKFDLSANSIKENLYRKENPNTYLATFAKFMIDNKSDSYFKDIICLLYTSPSPRDLSTSRMPSSA